MSRCDLHIHSKFSARSEDWLFRRFDFPDSCTEPLDVYTQLREHGMDFVTLTDHDCIDGCLAIADKPRTFISEQVTTYFPKIRVSFMCWSGGFRQRSTKIFPSSVATFSSCKGTWRKIELRTPSPTRSTASTGS